jgi:hypothetical protein
METTWAPDASDCRMTAVVAEPEEKARAKRACSSAAIAVSKLSLSRESQRHSDHCRLHTNRFGFELLVYS